MAEVTERVNFETNLDELEKKFNEFESVGTSLDKNMDKLKNTLKNIRIDIGNEEAIKKLNEDFVQTNQLLQKFAQMSRESGSSFEQAFSGFNLSDVNNAIEETAVEFQQLYIQLSDRTITAFGSAFLEELQKIESKSQEVFASGDLVNAKGIISEINEIEEKIKEYNKYVEDIRNSVKGIIPDSELAKIGEFSSQVTNELNRVSETARSEVSRIQEAVQKEAFENSAEGIKEQIRSISEEYRVMFSQGDFSGLLELNNKLLEIRNNVESLRESSGGLDRAYVDSVVSGLNAEIDTIAAGASRSIQTELTKGFTKAFSSLKSIAKESFSDTYRFATGYVHAWGNLAKGVFGSLTSKLSSDIRNAFSRRNTGIDTLGSQLKRLVGYVSVISLGKTAIDYASSMIEIQNVTDNVFKEMSDDVDNFAENYSARFGLVELQSKKMLGIFGGILSSSGIAGEAQKEMSKNLTALAGDVASFYNMDVDTVFKKLQSGLTGNVAAMRSFGVSMTVANLEAYALSQGITKSYQSMSQAEKTALRYNYMLSQLSVAQGDYSRTSQSWANQVRTLSNNFKELMGILGGGLIKALYPVVQLLNQLVVSAINGANALARLFGFKGIDLAEMMGGSGGMQFPDAAGYADDVEEAADATDNLAKATEKANKQLAAYDKLNNITTQDSTQKSEGGASGLGGLIDFASYYKDVEDLADNNKVQEWLDGLWEKLNEHDYYGAGKYIADSINDMMSRINSTLDENSDNIKNNIGVINDVITDFLDGLLEINTEQVGSSVGKGLNIILYYFDDLYTKLSDKGILGKIGTRIADFFNGLADNVDWGMLGKLFTTKLRVVFDILTEFLETAKPEDYGISFKEFLLGAIKRLFGEGGAEEIGKNLAGLVNFALYFMIGTFGDEKVINAFGDSIVKVLNSGIENIDEKALKDSLKALLNNLGNLMSKLGKEVEWGKLGTTIGESINGAVDDGSVSVFAKGFTDLILGLFETLYYFIHTVDWLQLGSEILKGIIGGIRDNQAGWQLLKEAFMFLFVTRLVANVGQLGLDIASKAIISKIAGHIASTGSQSLIAGAMSSVFGQAMLGTGIIAAEIFIGEFVRNLQMDKHLKEMADVRRQYLDDWEVDVTKITQQTSLSMEEEAAITRETLDGLKSTLSDYSAEIERIAVDDNWFDTLFGTQDWEDLVDLKAEMKEYIKTLEDMGYADNEYVIKAKEFASSFSLTVAGMSADVNNIMQMLGQLAVELQNNENQFVEAGILTADAYTESMNGAVEAGVNVVRGGGYRIGEGLISTAEESITGGGHRLNNATTSVVNTALDTTDSISRTKSRAIGTNIVSEQEAGILSGGASIRNSIRSTVEVALSEGESTGKTKGRALGSNIIDGVNEGVEAKKPSLLSKLSGLASTVLNTFASVLDIHSPSGAFRDKAQWIPSGIAEGIEDNKDEALDSIDSLASGLVRQFDMEQIDMSDMIDISKFKDLFENVEREYDTFSETLADKISSTNLSGLQTDLLVTPTVKKGELDSLLKQSQSNANIEKAMQSIYASIRGQEAEGSAPVYVSVYLDNNNKLEDFIIDTVNGRVIKGGKF